MFKTKLEYSYQHVSQKKFYYNPHTKLMANFNDSFFSYQIERDPSILRGGGFKVLPV